MALFHDSAIAGASGQAAGGAYKIERSLRFNSIDSAYLGRTPASAGNRRTWTWSSWVKRGNSTGGYIFGCDFVRNSTQSLYIYFADNISVLSWGLFLRTTTQVFRDYSAWYHLVVTVDTTDATANNRIRIYVNGTEITTFSTLNNPTQNQDLGINQAAAHRIGDYGAGTYWDGYLADIHFIDGQALTPSSFAETNATTGQWVPKAYTGTYGTNGFRLAFADNSNNTATTLGKDSSPNGNNWTPNNLSVTAGAGNDSLVDTPTSYGTDTGAGGEVRGNYCTWNPLARVGIYTASLSNGNLDCTSNADARVAYGSIAIPSSGKWFFEVTVTTSSTGAYVGVASYNGVQAAYPQDTVFPSVTYYGSSGQKDVDGVYSTYGSAYTNAVIGVAVNVDSSQVTFYKDGVSQGVINKSVVGTFPFVGTAGGTYTYTINAGQRPFAYTAPSGFKALCDTNLPAPVVAKPNTAFDVALWTGNGSARSITGLNFNPDFVWIKGRSGATDHALYDAVRGATIDLVSNSTAAETTQTQGLTAFNSDGFSLGTLAKVNTNTATYAGWAWDAGSSTVTNTQGSITSQVRANASAGFSIVTFPGGTSGDKTVGHGLGVSPQFIIIKSRTVADGWVVFHSTVCNTVNKYLIFATNGLITSAQNIWGSALPSSSVFGVSSGNLYTSNADQVAYCFAPVAGYSSFGSYTGNGSADGPFVYTGMRPRWILFKNTSVGVEDWWLHDTARNTYNVMTSLLVPNSSGAEATNTAHSVDALSNGFKIRTSAQGVNGSSQTVIYAAFAENCFQYARAR